MTYVIVDGSARISSLSCMDGYPSGEGKGILAFLSNRKNVDKLRRSLDRCEPLTDEFVQRMRQTYGGSWEEAYIESHPQHIYFGGARMLESLVSSRGAVTVRNWPGDRRFDDWAYVVDLDAERFEVYKGTNREPVPEGQRFYDSGGMDEHGYFPFRMVASYDFGDLPSYAEFIEACETQRGRRPSSTMPTD